MNRLAVSSRAYGLATILGLALASGSRGAIQTTILLSAIAAIAGAASALTTVPPRWVAFSEGGLGAMLAGFTLPESQPVLPYLIVPALLSGLGSGLFAVVATVAVESFALATTVVFSHGSDGWAEPVQLAIPWLLTALASGALGAWFRNQHRTVSDPAVDETYEAARRLLSQLRTVARRLSSGLDSASLASQLMITAGHFVQATQAGVFVRTESGLLSPLGYSPPSARNSLEPDQDAVTAAVRSRSPAAVAQPVGQSERRYLIALPLRTPSAVIGVLLVETPDPPADRQINGLQAELDAQSLRLDAALAFDEVRSLATLEERQRLAREIHDGVAQEVASLGYSVDEIMAGAVTDAQRQQLQTLRGEISRVVTELRHSIFDLRSEISETAGLGSALSDYVRTVGTRSGVTVHLTLDEAPTRLRPEVETELFRIAQEAITNARKHSQGRNLWVDCRIRPPMATIMVRDDGTGMGDARGDSYGVRIMHERARRIGATLTISGGIAGAPGTTVQVTVGSGPDLTVRSTKADAMDGKVSRSDD